MSWRRLATVAVLGVLVGSCAESRGPLKESPPVGSGTRDGLVKTSVLLAAQPEPTATELNLLIAGGACGDDVQRTRLDHVEVRETTQTVTVTAFTYIENPLPKGAACADVGLTIPAPVVLKAPLGQRDLLDGACAPTVAVRVAGETRPGCQAPTPPVPQPPSTGQWRTVDPGPLATRGEPQMVWTGREVIVVGGLIIDQYQALSDGAAFNPSTMEAFSTHGNGTLTVVKEKSPTSFEVEQNLQTMNGARTITFDNKTQHIFTMSQERGPAPTAPPAGGRGGPAPAVPGSFTILEIGK